jgi:DNA-directed RNA polymerase specialized sigma subunit
MAKLTKPQLIALQKKLGTDQAIGDKVGVTRQAIHQLRNKYGIDSLIAKNAERNKKIVVLYKTGKTGTDIAKKFDLSVSQTYRIISLAGKKKKK